jgi:glutathione S-transferase
MVQAINCEPHGSSARGEVGRNRNDRRSLCLVWLLGQDYALADIKWYSTTPGLARMPPDTVTSRIERWLDRMAARPAVQQHEDYRRPA